MTDGPRDALPVGDEAQLAALVRAHLPWGAGCRGARCRTLGCHGVRGRVVAPSHHRGPRLARAGSTRMAHRAQQHVLEFGALAGVDREDLHVQRRAMISPSWPR
jgi:hypothetical protein